MRKPNPLDTLWYGFKCFTAAFGTIGGMCILVGSLVFLGSLMGLWCLVTGGLMYALGKDLTATLQAEDKNKPDDDDDPGEAVRTV